MEAYGALYFVALLGWAVVLMALLPRLRAGAALFCGACGMLFVSYYGVITLSLMRPTAYLVIYGGLVCLPVGIVGLWARHRRELLRRFCSPGLGLFVVACALCVLTTRGAVTHAHDDLSYWARAPKELYTFDTFYFHAQSTMFHMDYIPLLASLQYCVTRVFGWQEASLIYVTYSMIAVSAALLADLPHKRRIGIVLGGMALYALGVFGFASTEIRADGPMLMVFTAALLSLIWRDADDIAALLPALCATAVLVGFKIYSGLMYAVVLALAMLAAWLGARKQRESTRTMVVVVLLACALPLLLQLSWRFTFNLAQARATADATALNAAYAGETLQAVESKPSLSRLLSGNDRTGRFFATIGGDLTAVSEMVADTCSVYLHSHQPLMWLFWLPVALLLPLASRRERLRCAQTLGWLLLAGVIYLLGLFASYLVQSETAGSASLYLRTATSPMLIGAITCAALLAQKRPLPSGGALAAMLVGMLLLRSPASLPLFRDKSAEPPSIEMASTLFEDDLDGLLTEDDAGKRALLIDCSYAASEIKSPSEKTHVYGYVGLPLRVVVAQLPWGDYSELEQISEKTLHDMIRDARAEMLILNVDDELYWDAIYNALELPDDAEPIGLYDVTYQDGEFEFELRWN